MEVSYMQDKILCCRMKIEYSLMDVSESRAHSEDIKFSQKFSSSKDKVKLTNKNSRKLGEQFVKNDFLFDCFVTYLMEIKL